VHYAAVRVLRAVRAYGFLAAGVVLVGASLLAPSSDGTPLIMAALLTIGERHRRAIVENRRVIVEHNRPRRLPTAPATTTATTKAGTRAGRASGPSSYRYGGLSDGRRDDM
jgi:hypothetical protein